MQANRSMWGAAVLLSFLLCAAQCRAAQGEAPLPGLGRHGSRAPKPQPVPSDVKLTAPRKPRSFEGHSVQGFFGEAPNLFTDSTLNAIAGRTQQPTTISDSNAYEFGFEGKDVAAGTEFFVDLKGDGTVTFFGKVNVENDWVIQLKSPAFKKVKSFQKVSKNANATATLDKDTITFTLSGVYPSFSAVWKLRAPTCDPDVDKCCKADGSGIAIAGTVCRKAQSPCEVDTVCNGVDEFCEVTVKVNGAKCPYTPSPAEMAESSGGQDPYHVDHGRDEERHWPLCFGRCQAGTCEFKFGYIHGCCHVPKPAPAEKEYDEYSAYEPELVGGPLYCWSGNTTVEEPKYRPEYTA